MKISKRDLSIIMILVGLMIAFFSYQFSFRSAMTEKENLESQCDSLQAELDALMDFGMDEQYILTQTGAYEKELSDLVASYPVKYTYEDAIMYLYNFEQSEKLEILFPKYNIVETYIINTHTGEVNGVSKTYAYGQSTIEADYTVASCKEMRSFLSSIYVDSYKKNVEKVTMVFEPTTGIISGNITINMFSMLDGVSNEYEEPEIPAVEMKPPCIFGPTVTPTPIVTPDEEPVEE